MKLLRQSQKGFTLLELILALGIVGFIVSISLGAIRLGASAQEIGHIKIDTFQRLRFIQNQITQKIKSTYPVFIFQNKPVFASKNPKKNQRRLLAFEGTSDSIRFVTFSSPLTSQDRSTSTHETYLYNGQHPESGKSGIIMAERTIISEYTANPILNNLDQRNYFLLAENVAYFKLRYYQIEKLSSIQRQDTHNNNSFEYQGKWVTSVKQEFLNTLEESKNEEREDMQFGNNNKISLPRAVEISLGLHEESISGTNNEPAIIFSSPIVIPLYSGMRFALPKKQDENNSIL